MVLKNTSRFYVHQEIIFKINTINRTIFFSSPIFKTLDTDIDEQNRRFGNKFRMIYIPHEIS